MVINHLAKNTVSHARLGFADDLAQGVLVKNYQLLSNRATKGKHNVQEIGMKN